MQTSEPLQNSRRKNHQTAVIACSLALFVLINILLCFLIEPYRSSSYEMWSGFRGKSAADLVYIGTSWAECAIDPSIVDASLGTHSYNMATNMQSLACSFDAVKTAFREKNVMRVVLCIDFDILSTNRKDNMQAEQSYYHAKCSTESLPAGMRDSLSYVFDPSVSDSTASITYWFPWIYNRSFHIRTNVEEKIKKAVTDPSGHRDENGYEPTDEVVKQSHFTTKDEAEAWSEKYDLIVPTITDENRRTLSSILTYCSENNIELTVISIPAANTFDIYEYKDYLALTDTVDEICQAAGQHFYNFNLLDEDQLSIPIDGYKDVGHTNSKGAAIFSGSLAEFLKNKSDIH